MRRTPAPHLAAQRGAAALIATMLLFFAMVLVAVFVNRNLVFEQRSSANQYRSTQAFEAAEAGLEWALAQLNSPQRIGPDCRPTTDPAATSFRARYLSFNRSGATFTPTSWMDDGNVTALQASCVRNGGAWSCSCPAHSAPALTPPAGNAAAPAFTLEFVATPRPGVVRVTASGCTSLAGACLPGSTTRADATARIEVAFGLLAGLLTPPVAAVTTRGAFDADTATLGAHNPDPATGVAIHAGGPITASQARLTPPAGASLGASLIGLDPALAQLSPDQFFVSHFGQGKAAWKAQPAVATVSCRADCGPALLTAIAASAGGALVWVDGDLSLAGPLTLGSAARPVVIVVNGTARFDGAIGVHGVVYSAAMRWDNAGSGAYVRGAVLSEDSYRGDATAEFYYDTAVMDTLSGNTGSFARIAGSWRDF